MTRVAIRRVVLVAVVRILSLLGFAGMVGVATQANANLDRERAALEKRLESAREALRGPAQGTALYPRGEAPTEVAAQQVRRPAWNNWPNWNNWANWFNR